MNYVQQTLAGEYDLGEPAKARSDSFDLAVVFPVSYVLRPGGK